MEALAGFGLACNVMQTISFAREAVDVGRAIYQGESVDPNLVYTTQCLENCLQNLQRSLESEPQPMTQESRELVDIVKDSLATGASIRDELTQIFSLSQKGRPGATVRSWIRFFRGSKRKLQEFDREMQTKQHVLETRLLARVCKNTDAALIQSQNGFKDLDAVLQGFVLACAQGQTSLEHLLVNQSASIKTHVSDETTKLQERMRKDIINESGRVSARLSSTLEAMQSAKVDKQDRDRFLGSLKYVGMDERRDHVREPHKDTFEWVFHSIKDEISTEDDTSDSHSYDGSDCSMQMSSICSTDGDESIDSNDSSNPSEDFVEWLGSNNPLPYWLSGKAGSGKSTFMLFLTEHPKTAEVLNLTQKSPVLLSHFIWAAGEPLQRSLKGILGKLLYELLLHDDVLCSLVLANFRYAKGKSQIHEWPNKHLEKLAFEAFSASDKGVCIFLDGVDEAEDQDAIIGLVKRLNAIPQVRICLSSRPEPLLLESLRQYPKLYMQYLTRSDIYRYTFAELSRISREDKAQLNNFVNKICDKANGVFLWARLVVELFRKGRCYGDNLEERFKYLEKLPDDLQRLYERMWEKENSNQPGYKKDAAQYLNIMLLYVETAQYFVGEMHAVHMVMALMPTLATAIINNSNESILKEVKKLYKITTSRLSSRTAGLLEVTSSGYITFIHRSAYEFLRNSDLGRDILQLDTTNEESREMNLIKGYLAFLDLIWLHRSRGGPMFNEIDAKRHTLCLTLERFRRAHIERRINGNGMFEILVTAKKIYQRGHWKYQYNFSPFPDYPFQPEFLAAATYAGFLDYANDELQRLKLNTPVGMELSARYKNYFCNIICTSSIAVPESADRIASLIQALDKEPALSRTPCNLISLGYTDMFGVGPLISKRNLLQDLLSQWTYTIMKDEDGVGRLVLQLYQAGFNVLDRMLVQLVYENCQTEGTYALHAADRRYASIENGATSVFMETTVESLLKILTGHATEPESKEAGVLREIATAVNSSTAAFIFKVIALRNWPGTKDVLIPAEMEDIGSAFRPFLDIFTTQNDAIGSMRSMGRSMGLEGNTLRTGVIIPGLQGYLDKISATAKHITYAEFDEMLIRDGYMFRRDEELQNWPPEPYSPTTEASTSVQTD